MDSCTIPSELVIRMTFSSLLCHTATVSYSVETNTGGHITKTWTSLGEIPCRFTNPTAAAVQYATAQHADKIDAVVFANPNLLTTISGKTKPIRLTTTDSGYAGTYEIQVEPHAVYAHKTLRHVEIPVKKVTV